MREGVAARDAAGLLPAAMQSNCWTTFLTRFKVTLVSVPGCNYSSIKS